MACIITSKCVNCEMCVPDCPHSAVSYNGKTFVIDSSKCTECKDAGGKPRCIEICPLHCIFLETELKKLQKMSGKSHKKAG